jgi:hypothetical protein
LRFALAPARTHGPWLALEGGTRGDGPLREWRALGKLGWLWQTAPSMFRLYGGPRVGGGVVVQQVEGERTLSSGVGTFGAGGGFGGRISQRLGVFADLDLAAQLLKQDDVMRFTFAPSGWAGASWEL